MKKLFSLVMLVFALCVFTVPLIAQGTDPVEPQVEILDYFLSLPSVATAVLLLTGLAFSKWPYAAVWVKQVVSLVIGAGVGALGYWYNAGYFEGETLVYSLLSGIGAALMANGLYSYGLVAGFLELIKLKLPTKK